MQSHHQQSDNRALLFGQRPTTHRRSQPHHQTNVDANEREMLENANDQRVDGLRGRVGEMRHVSNQLPIKHFFFNIHFKFILTYISF